MTHQITTSTLYAYRFVVGLTIGNYTAHFVDGPVKFWLAFEGEEQPIWHPDHASAYGFETREVVIRRIQQAAANPVRRWPIKALIFSEEGPVLVEKMHTTKIDEIEIKLDNQLRAL